MRLVLVLPALLLLAAASVSSAAVEGNLRVSVETDGNEFAAGSGSTTSLPAISSDGSAVVFESLGGGIESDTNRASDVYLRLTEGGTTELVSATPDGRPGNSGSTQPSMSGDGRIVAFRSLATDLSGTDSNNLPDIFVKDRTVGTVNRMAGAAEPDGPSYSPSVSPDGAVVAFCSSATNLAGGGASSGVFVYETQTGNVSEIGLGNEEREPTRGCHRIATGGPGGRFIAFSYSDADDFGRVYLYDRDSGETQVISDPDGDANGPSGLFGLAVSETGDRVAFDSPASNLVSGDENGASDVFLWQRGEDLRRISVNAGGEEGNGDSGSMGLGMSSDGRWLVFSSSASNLLPGDANGAADVFRADLDEGSLTLASVDVGDKAPNGPSYSPDISDDGQSVSFASLATNIVFTDRNRQPDVFIRGGEFLEVAGRGDGGDTPTPDPALIPPRSNGDGSGVPGWAILAGAIAAVAAGLVGLWFVLGRQPEA